MVHAVIDYPELRGWREITINIELPLGWDAGPSQVSLQHFDRLLQQINRYPFIVLGVKSFNCLLSFPVSTEKLKLSGKPERAF